MDEVPSEFNCFFKFWKNFILIWNKSVFKKKCIFKLFYYRLRVPNFHRLHSTALLVLASRVSAAHHLVRGRAFVLWHFSAPAPAGFCVFLWTHSPPIGCFTSVNLSTDRPSFEPPFSRLLYFNYWRVPSQHNCWFKFFATSIRQFRYSLLSPRFSLRTVNTSSCQFAHTLPALLWEVPSDFQFIQSSVWVCY